VNTTKLDVAGLHMLADSLLPREGANVRTWNVTESQLGPHDCAHLTDLDVTDLLTRDGANAIDLEVLELQMINSRHLPRVGLNMTELDVVDLQMLAALHFCQAGANVTNLDLDEAHMPVFLQPGAFPEILRTL